MFLGARYRYGITAVLSALCVLLVGGVVWADGALISQTYRTSETDVPSGSLVSLQKDSKDSVELSDTTNVSRLVGVVGKKAFLEVSNGGAGVLTVTNGTAQAWVSDINGDIAVGDRITASPIKGVGMKATQNGVIIGVARTALADVQATERTITGDNGEVKTVHIGSISVQVNVSTYTAKEGPVALSFLADIAQTIAGRPVSWIRILLASFLATLLFAAVVVMLYTGIRSSVISIGRNPLSEGALRKALLHIGLLAIGVTVVGLAVVYLILKV